MRNAYRLDGSVIYLSVGEGVEACIDAEDLPLVSPYTWKAWASSSSKNGKRLYVQAGDRGKTIYLHRVLMKAGEGIYVDHINHDTLDNRKANLRLVTHQENDMNRDGAYNTSKTGIRGVSTHKANKGGLLYVFRCHGRNCRDCKYFPHTPEGLVAAERYSLDHHAQFQAGVASGVD